MCELKYNSYGCENSNDYKPCEHIDDVMQELNIYETNEENNNKIKEYLFKNCCSKNYSKWYYIKQFIMNVLKNISR